MADNQYNSPEEMANSLAGPSNDNKQAAPTQYNSPEEMANQLINGPPSTVQKVTHAVGQTAHDLSGSTYDTFFGNNGILTNAGAAASQAWGARPFQRTLDKFTSAKDDDSTLTGYAKAFNSVVLRPIAAAADTALTVGATDLQVLGGVGQKIAGGLESIAQQGNQEYQQEGTLGKILGAPREAIDTAVGGASEYLGSVASGEYLPEEGLVHLEQKTAQARAKTALGEGEESYFNTIKPHPEDLQDRQAVAQKVGVEPAPEYPTTNTNLDWVARQTNPDAFKEWDAKLDYHDELENRLNQWEDQGTIPGTTEEPPELSALKEQYQDNHKRLKELEPEINDAYTHAQTLMPPEDELKATLAEQEKAHTASQEAQEAQEEKGVSSTGQPLETPVAPSEGLWRAPKGSISDDVAQKLVATGTDPEVAQAAGQITEAQYNARATRFGGRLGNAQDLYKERFPTVVAGRGSKGGAKARVLNQLNETSDRLRVARRMPDGSVKIGEPGQLHMDLISDEEMDRKAAGFVGMQESDMGFATPEGKYLTREEAFNWVKEHNPEFNEQLMHGGPRNQDALESTGYEKEIDKANRYKNATEGEVKEPELETSENLGIHAGKVQFEHEAEIAELNRLATEDFNNKHFGPDRFESPYKVTAGKIRFEHEAELADIGRVAAEAFNTEHFGEDRFKTDQTQTLDQSKRGSISFVPNGRAVLRLFKSQNASTPFHELGHLWLEELSKDALHPEAPDELKQDWKTVKDFLGIKEEQSQISRPQHELFARTFERYLREGNAPSEELKSVFAKIKDWLLKVYQHISEINAPISNPVREVFDRLLTEKETEENIRQENINSNTVRMYHGYDEGTLGTGGSRWATPDPEYAKNYRGDKNVAYIDLPKGSDVEKSARLWDDIDEQTKTNMVGRYKNVELPEEYANKLKPLEDSDNTLEQRDRPSHRRLPAIKGTGEETNYGLANRINDILQNDLGVEATEDSTRKTAQFKLGRAKVAEHVAANPQEAYEIAMGNRPVKITDATPEMYFLAMSNYALVKRDIQMLDDLKNSRLITEVSAIAQRLGSLRGGYDDTMMPNIVLLQKTIEEARKEYYQSNNTHIPGSQGIKTGKLLPEEQKLLMDKVDKVQQEYLNYQSTNEKLDRIKWGNAFLDLKKYVDGLKPKYKSDLDKAYQYTGEALGIFKQLQTNVGHMSAGLVQLLGSISHKEWWTGYAKMLKYMMSEGAYNDERAYMITSPWYRHSQVANLGITDISTKLNNLEEEIGSHVLQNINTWAAETGGKLLGSDKALPINLVRANSRGFTGMQNYVRFRVFENQMEAAKLSGEDASVGGQASKDIAAAINDFTGRGNLGTDDKLRNASVALNAVFYAARKNVAEFQMFNPLEYIKPGLSPTARKLRFRNLAGLTLAVGGVLLLAKATGHDVNMDPRADDFGLIPIGKTKVDLFPGIRTMIRFLAQEVTQTEITTDGRRINLLSGEETDSSGNTVAPHGNTPNGASIFLKFLRGKLAPTTSIAWDRMNNADQVGNEFNLGRELKEKSTPIFANNFLNFADNDLQNGEAWPFAFATMLGVGITEPIPEQARQGMNWWGEPYSATESKPQTDLDRAFKSVGAHLGFPSRMVKGVRLNDEQYHDYIQMSGQSLSDAASFYVNSPSWQLDSTEDRKKALQGFIRDSRRQAANGLAVQPSNQNALDQWNNNPLPGLEPGLSALYQNQESTPH